MDESDGTAITCISSLRIKKVMKIKLEICLGDSGLDQVMRREPFLVYRNAGSLQNFVELHLTDS